MNKYEDIYSRLHVQDTQSHKNQANNHNSVYNTPEKGQNSFVAQEARPARNSLGGGIRRYNPKVSEQSSDIFKHSNSLGKSFELKKVQFDSPLRSDGKKMDSGEFTTTNYQLGLKSSEVSIDVKDATA